MTKKKNDWYEQWEKAINSPLYNAIRAGMNCVERQDKGDKNE